MVQPLTDAEFLAIAKQNPVNAELLKRLPALGLNQCHLTAGCLFQAVWNHLSGQPKDWGVSDYDVIYFDDTDLSEKAEEQVVKRVERATEDLGVNVEVTNQARVHIWYPQLFRAPYPPTAARPEWDRSLFGCLYSRGD